MLKGRNHMSDRIETFGPVVVVEAAACLLAQGSRLDHPLLDGVWAKAWLAKKCIVDRAGHSEIDIYSYEVHQFERAHTKTGAPHGLVNLHHGCCAFTYYPQGLPIERPRYPVDYEAGHVCRDNGHLSEVARKTGNALNNLRRRPASGYHLNQGHHRCGVEKVHTCHAAGVLRG